MTPARWQADLALAGVALIWGSTFVLVKNVLDEVSTVLFLALRFGIATTALGMVYWSRCGPGRTRVRRSGEVLGGVLAGVFLYAGYLLQTLGLKLTTPAKAGFITGLYIPLVPLLIASVYRRVPRPYEWVGFSLAVAGMGLMTLDGSGFTIGTGDLLILGCAFAFAVHIIVLGYYSRRMATDWLTLLQIGTCAIIAGATYNFVERPQIRWSTQVISALLITSILGTAVAFWVQTWGQRHTTTVRTALIFALEPVFAWLASYLFAGELFTARAAFGAVCILSGILIVELKPASTEPIHSLKTL